MLNMVQSEATAENGKYASMNEAVTDLRREVKRQMISLEGNLKMSNARLAGPFNTAKRKEAAKGLFLEAAKELSGAITKITDNL